MTAALQTALRRFERMTSFQIRYDLILAWEKGADTNSFYSIDPAKKEIRIFLDRDPKEVTATAPVQVSQRLADIFFEVFMKGEALTSGIRFNVFEDVARIEDGERMIHSFFTRDSDIVIERPQSSWEFNNLIQKYGLETMKRKLAYSFLAPHIKPALDIEAEVEQEVSVFSSKVLSTVVDPADLNFWDQIAKLAMLATLAKKYGAAPSYIKCQSLLMGSQGQELASIELLQAPSSVLKYLQRYPYESRHQLRLVTAGYNILFNSFQYVFDFHFDRMHIQT
jgi:hypothetical protein